MTAWCILLLVLTGISGAAADDHYVSLSGGHVAPFTNWVTAATNIQAAIDASSTGDTVWVTNGIYDVGGATGYPASTNLITNRIAIYRPITVASVNGPDATVIKGAWQPGGTNGNAAVRCVYMTNGSTLIGFTLTNGATRGLGQQGMRNGDDSGGGVYCQDTNAVVSNCVIVGNASGWSGGGASGCSLFNSTVAGNAAGYAGGGAYNSELHSCTITGNFGSGTDSCMLDHCLVVGNSGTGVVGGSPAGPGGVLTESRNCVISGNTGGGASGGMLYNCTISGNSATWGAGGAIDAMLRNCIVYYNTRGGKVNNHSGCTFTYSCTTPDPGGTGNVTSAPGIASPLNPWLVEASVCRDAGSNGFVSWAADFEGEPRTNGATVDIGSDEFWPSGITGALTVSITAAYTNVAVGFALDFSAEISGRPRGYAWSFGDGQGGANDCAPRHAFSTAGVYGVVLDVSNYTGTASATVTVRVLSLDAATHFVAPGGGHVSPFTNWITAATNIQAAVEVCEMGGLILVSNGVYQTGGMAGYPTAGYLLTNRVVIDRPVTVASVNGPGVTVIKGSWNPVSTNGAAAVRCVYMCEGATLAGFTLTNGATRTSGITEDLNGGGLLCENTNAAISNCVITGNAAASDGGGVCYGTLRACEITGNHAGGGGGGAVAAVLYDCALSGNRAQNGGGSRSSTHYGGSISSNAASADGGGVSFGSLLSCALTGNSATRYAGGAYQAYLSNCTVSANTAGHGGGAYASSMSGCTISGNSVTGAGGGACYGYLYNCTVVGNVAGGGGGIYQGSMYSCTISGNSSAGLGGGAMYGSFYNCIVYFNSASGNENHYQAAFTYSCTTPQPGGAGNITNEPALVHPMNPRLLENSPCRDAGKDSYVSWTLDRDGEPRTNGLAVDMGGDEYWPAGITGAVSASVTGSLSTVALGYPLDFSSLIAGRVRGYTWSFGDGSAVTNSCSSQHLFPTAGVYTVVLAVSNYTDMAAATVTVTVLSMDAATHYVAPGGGHVPPFTNWATAATNIQSAIDSCEYGGLVLVSNGVYGTGGVAGYPAVTNVLTNRVAIHRPITIRSVNGPAATAIQGSGPTGIAAVRCVYITNGARLVGFTLTIGATLGTYPPIDDSRGGGLWCAGSDAVISNCLITANAADEGGGAAGGTLVACTLRGNSAVSAGGAVAATLYNCTIEGNTAQFAGGVGSSTLFDCLVYGNVANTYDGGGAYFSTLNNCTVVSNTANSAGGGLRAGTLNNSIVYFNSAPTNANCYLLDTASYSCTTPALGGAGNTTNAPTFVDVAATNLRLRIDSPCMDAGANAAWMTNAVDLDGNPRLFNGKVDMGAYEFTIRTDLRVLLEGAYNTGSNAMSQGAIVPWTSPYCEDPRLASAIPTGAVDWVLAQIFETNGMGVVATRSALVRGDGTIVDDDGGSGLRMDCAPNRAYWIVVKHRNHLSVMSDQPVAFTNAAVGFDFTAVTNGAVELEPGIWGLAAGDADGDGRVTATDGAIVTLQDGRSGYLPGDLDLSGTVDANDAVLASVRAGLETLATNGAVALCPQLVVSPSRKTVVSSSTVTLAASGSTNAITWFGLQNRSGGTLTGPTATSIVYTAGGTSDCIDITEAWDGDGRFGRSYQNVISPAEVAKAGKAVVIAGRKGPEDTLWPATDYLANNAYITLLYRGYGRDNVEYLGDGTGRDIDGNGVADDIDMTATVHNVAWSFTNWVGNTAKLFVYFVDHGEASDTNGYFRLNSAETVSASALDGWLDALQNSYTTEVTVVIDCCYAKTLANQLTYTGAAKRIVLASSGTNEPAYFIGGGLVSFSDAFFAGVMMGLDVSAAHEQALEAMASYQESGYQDNGSGTEGTNVILGSSFVAGKDLPQIGLVCGRQVLNGGTEAELWARDVVSAYPVERVWCLVVPPGHSPTNAADPVQDIPVLELEYSPTSGRYEGRYGGFAEEGSYKILYYAQDVWQSVSLPKQSYVDQAGHDERVMIVAGQSAQTATVEALKHFAYEAVRARGIPTNRIYVLGLAGTNNGPPTVTNVKSAITNWAWGSDRLTVYLVGDGTNEVFRLMGTNELTASDLGNWLNLYQSTNRAVNVVMDFAGSGAFAPYLQPPADRERIIVASCRAGWPNVMEAGGQVSFSQYFFTEIFKGRTIGQAETKARKAIRRASGLVRQRSGLDDDGDGVLSEKNVDGLIANTRYIGAAFATGGEGPEIGGVIPVTALTNGTSLAIWAGPVTAVDGISNVWCVITPPEYDETGDLVRVDLAYAAGSNRWEALYTEFTNAGSYMLTFYAMDSNGEVSAAVQSEVVRPDRYEVDDEHTLAHPYYVGTYEEHTFHTSTDRDWMWFYAQTGTVYEVETVHLWTNVDTMLDLYYLQADGTLTNVDHIDDFGNEEGELAGLNFPQEGMYFVEVSPYVTNDWTPGSYEVVIDIPSGDGVLVVIAAIWPTTNALPAGSLASLDGDVKYFNGAVSVSYPTVAGGTHLLAVYSGDPNVVPVEDPNYPGQTANPWNPAYGDPKYAQVQQVRRGMIAGSVGFSFIGKIRADGEIRDQATHVRLTGAGIRFRAASGYLTNYVINGDPFYANYKTVWASQGNGQFPNNVWLPAQTLHMTLSNGGYHDYNQNNVMVNPAAGSTPNVGTKYLVPVDNDGDGMRDSWEQQYFGTTAHGASGDVDGDGQSNWQEYMLGTGPTNPDETLKEQAANTGAGGLTLRWPVTEARQYRIGSSLSVTGAWSVVAGPWEAAQGQTQMEWTATMSTGTPQRLYRVEALVP